MGVLQEKMTRSQFRKCYGNQKPSYELIDGEPQQKAMGSMKHGRLQGLLFVALESMGFIAITELTMQISDIWELVPDVVGLLTEKEEICLRTPPAVVIEILSPTDSFSSLQMKIAKYAEWGIADILVFDPVRRKVWCWDLALDALVPIADDYKFWESLPKAVLSLSEVWRHLDAKLGK